MEMKNIEIGLYRYDRNLSPMARLFYAEMCADYKSKHYIFINDEYYAKKFKITDRQIRRLRSELLKNGYIAKQFDEYSKKTIIVPKII